MKLQTLNVQTLLFVLGILFLSTWAQSFPDTIYIPVTFFDFHSDFDAQGQKVGCPEFNPCPGENTVGLKANMVQNTLDADGLPAAGSNVYFSKYLANWYRSSAGGEQPVTDVYPRYDYGSGNWLVNDTPNKNPWENIKILDTLPFVHIGDGTNYPLGTYEFKDTSFFPLDGRGFGNEPTWSFSRLEQLTNHNYAFTMMMKTEFTYQRGMKFHFSGDDDVWVFVEDQLVLDIGGIHEELADDFNADDLNLQVGQKYTLSFFFAERQADLCHITITSNMITHNPNKVNITVHPNDTIYVGDTLIASATILTDTGEVSINELPGSLTWGYRDLYANNPSSTFASRRDTATFIPTEAWTTVEIFAHYNDNGNNVHLKDTVDIVVLPGKPDGIVIEASPEKPNAGSNALWDNNPLNEVTIGESEEFNERFYAILRDKEQNWIGPADPVDSWSSSDASMITAQKGADPSKGQGRANRATWSKVGFAYAIAKRDTLGKQLIDSIKVILEGQKFAILKAVYYENDSRPDGLIDLINVTVDDKLTITSDVLEKLYPNITLPAERNFTFDKDDLSVTSKGFSIAVTQAKGTKPNTAIDPSIDKLKITETQIAGIGAIGEASLSIVDSLAPVVLFGTFCPSADITNKIKDTLIVDFSEKVAALSDKYDPFDFFDISKLYPTGYSMRLSPMNTSSEQQVTFIVEEKDKTYPQNGDSLWIDGNKGVSDILSIVQKRDTKPAPLVVKPYPIVTIIKILNPVSRSNPGLNPKLVELFKLKENPGGTEGTVVEVEISGHVENPKQLSAHLSILDAIGNVVRDDITSEYVEYKDADNKQHKALILVWNLRNKNNRKVGASAYCGILEVKNGSTMLIQKKVLFGVKN